MRASRRFKRIVLCGAVICMLLLLPCPAHAYSFYETETVLLGSASGNYSLELWHHSGGYWQVGSTAGKLIKVRDITIERAGIVGYLNATQCAKWSLPLPEKVRAALKAGRKVSAEAETNTALYVAVSCTISGTSSVDVYAIPIFHVATSATLNSFVPGINVTIPLISSAYGRNIYAIYGIRSAGAPGLGWFSNAKPHKILEPYIHPSLITNRLGWLKSGATINIRGEAVSTTGHTVGLLTLAGGGAVGLHFDFPIKVNFYEEVQHPVAAEDPQDMDEMPEDGNLDAPLEDDGAEEQLPLEDDEERADEDDGEDENTEGESKGKHTEEGGNKNDETDGKKDDGSGGKKGGDGGRTDTDKSDEQEKVDETGGYRLHRAF